MKLKAVSEIMLTLLLIGMLMLAFNIQPVKTEPTTIIVPDDYPTIQEAVNNANDGDIILVRAGIYYENVVVNKTVSLIGERKETTIIDGGGNGVVVNVTSSKTDITRFTIRNSGRYFPNSSICLYYANFMNITDNMMESSCYGILLYSSSSNTISGNNMINNSGHGIVLHESSSNTINRNNLTNNDSDAMNLFRSDKNCVYDNNIVNNDYGIWMDESSHNLFIHNNIENVTASYGHAIAIADSKYNSFIENNIKSNSNQGLTLYSSDNNSIIGNNVANSKYGVYLASSNGNHIYHNNIINNTFQTYIFDVSVDNTWDDGYPSGGNYWSDHVTVDDYSGINQDELGSDGIVDEPYIIDECNRDNYPLATPWSPVISVTIDIDPNTLNLKSKGQWITCYIELQEGYNVSDIEVSTILLNNTIPAEMRPVGIGDYDNDGIPDLMVKFERETMMEYLRSKGIGGAGIILTITGKFNGTSFEGSDTIRVR